MEEASGVMKVSVLIIPMFKILMPKLKLMGFSGSFGPLQSTMFESPSTLVLKMSVIDLPFHNAESY